MRFRSLLLANAGVLVLFGMALVFLSFSPLNQGELQEAPAESILQEPFYLLAFGILSICLGLVSCFLIKPFDSETRSTICLSFLILHSITATVLLIMSYFLNQPIGWGLVSLLAILALAFGVTYYRLSTRDNDLPLGTR